jgi:hypothetical protein
MTYYTHPKKGCMVQKQESFAERLITGLQVIITNWENIMGLICLEKKADLFQGHEYQS